MISPNEIKSKYFQNHSSEYYSHTLEVMIDNALKYDLDFNCVRCRLIFKGLATSDINIISKYIASGYDVLISTEPDKNDVTLTIYHYFDKE